MDWTQSIQRAINYIEAHLDEDIDYEAVAKEACSSVFHFQRVFGVLCGFTLGDYIRMRRLSRAAEQLLESDDRIIDIALRAGYETPESFSRAFSRFHGITPGEARRGGRVKYFSPLSVKLILTGGRQMDYRIEETPAFRLICKRRRVAKPQNASPSDITLYWKECAQDGSLARILGYMPEAPRMKGLLGVCFSAELEKGHFPYGIGVEYDGRPVTDDDLEIVEIPAHTFAVFTCRGQMPQVFTDTFARIVTEFFPQNSTYEYGSGVELEVYPSDDTSDPNYFCEIWIAVRKK